MKRTNKQGQALGRKGEESRRRLLDAARDLLASESVHKLSASKVARAAAMASQGFYLYFKDVDEILLALAEEASADIGAVVDRLREAAPATSPEVLSDDVIAAYSAHWDHHRAVLNARNYIADSGNMAFLKLRQEATMPMIYAIADRIEAAQPRALARSASVARAVIIYVAMERLASRSHAVQYSTTDASTADLRRAEIDILSLLFTPAPG